MSSAIITMSLAMAMQAFGLGNASMHHHDPTPGQLYIVPPGPGLGFGFLNGNPDGYGYVDYGVFLPLGADRTAEYYFPRYFAIPPTQMFPQTYYNAFETRGQRYIPYCGGGGDHPMGGPPTASSHLPVSPYTANPGNVPVTPVPLLNGRIEANPLSSGSSGLTP